MTYRVLMFGPGDMHRLEDAMNGLAELGFIFKDGFTDGAGRYVVVMEAAKVKAAKEKATSTG